ncbi:MAG TPA: GNAT family N-acetyltransferase [Thermoanaerobaculia bacterium]|nr:GNAT family N-acetyltransferase [Thermoanaerobaculia bacterium]
MRRPEQAERSEGDAPCELLAWDTEFFGLRIGRVRAARLDPQEMARVLSWARARAVACLYLLADPGDPATAPLAEEHGFRLVDVRITLERRLGPAAPADDLTRPAEPAGRSTRPAAPAGGLIRAARQADHLIRPAEPADGPELRRIAAASHRDSRFYYDPHFDRGRCDELYATWIEKSCRDEAELVLVAEHAGRPAGYITCLLAPGGEGRIGLFAVDEQAQGRGLGGRLIGEALDWFAGRGAERVSVVTQARNLRAQRIYQKFGMLTRAVGLWYHRWSEAGAADEGGEPAAAVRQPVAAAAATGPSADGRAVFP